MKRLRLLIYDGDAEWITLGYKHDAVKAHLDFGRGSITSIDLNPLRITVLELLRIFRREVKGNGR